MKVGVIDYGVGNLGSVLRTLEALRVHPRLIDRASDMHATDALILPGVGSFADCVELLEKGGWIAALRDEVLGYKRPLLGICLGMQLLADSSTEGASKGSHVEGLGFIPGQVVHLQTLDCPYRVPHIGWNAIQLTQNNHLFNAIPSGTDFYFVHSYAFVPSSQENVLATTDYGITVTAAIQRGHIWGTQFHPEKSSRAGYQLFKNFLAGPGC